MMRSKTIRSAWLALAFALLFDSADAGVEQTKILAPDGLAFDHFGLAVTVHGDTAVIGAPTDADVNGLTGSAYVFTRTAGVWSLQTKLLADDGASQDRFGTSVAFDGETLVVGADRDDDNGLQSGSAYVFTRTGGVWMQQAKLLASDGAPNDRFGHVVAVDGGTVVVGSTNGNDSSVEGAAYVFTSSAGVWAQQAQLTGSDQTPTDGFGTAVAVLGDTIGVGSPNDDDNGLQSGSVYIFTRTGTTWSQHQKLLPADGAGSDFFGESLAMQGETLVVGTRDGVSGTWSGTVYVFARTGTTWVEQIELFPDDGEALEEFGTSVAVHGDNILVGADRDDDNGTLSGSAYVFSRINGSWQQRFKLLPPDGIPGAQFGASVSLSGNTALVGAWGDDDNGNESGSAWAYELPPIPPPDDDPVPASGTAAAIVLLLSMLAVSAVLLRRAQRGQVYSWLKK